MGGKEKRGEGTEENYGKGRGNGKKENKISFSSHGKISKGLKLWAKAGGAAGSWGGWGCSCSPRDFPTQNPIPKHIFKQTQNGGRHKIEASHGWSKIGIIFNWLSEISGRDPGSQHSQGRENLARNCGFSNNIFHRFCNTLLKPKAPDWTFVGNFFSPLHKLGFTLLSTCTKIIWFLGSISSAAYLNLRVYGFLVRLLGYLGIYFVWEGWDRWQRMLKGGGSMAWKMKVMVKKKNQIVIKQKKWNKNVWKN